jgi:hypothetical protein
MAAETICWADATIEQRAAVSEAATVNRDLTLRGVPEVRARATAV